MIDNIKDFPARLRDDNCCIQDCSATNDKKPITPDFLLVSANKSIGAMRVTIGLGALPREGGVE